MTPQEQAFEAFMKALDHPHQWYGGRTYAQHGDDLAILNIFHCLKVERPSYLDVGAHHPYELSNTALLYQRGSRGVNVEANPALIENFRRCRPEDVNVWAAVVGAVMSSDGKVTFNRIHETCGLNSLLPVATDARSDVVEVPAVTINDIVRDHAGGQWPDLLSVDVEGMDIPVLESADFSRGGPKVIIAEFVSQQGSVFVELRNLLQRKGYVIHSQAGGNMIVVKRELMGKLR